MMTCAASSCKNTSVKGAKMCYFLKDNRRQLWLKNANLENKAVKSPTALCDFHFTSNIWERARRWNKKLKTINTAVPTIFREVMTQAINKKTTVNREATELSNNTLPELKFL